MARPARLLAGLALATGAVVLATAPAGAGKFGAINFDPNPVGAGGSTVASGICPTDADFVTVVMTVLGGGTGGILTQDFEVDPTTGAFSGSFAIPANADTQTLTADGECMSGVPGDANLVGLLQGELSITAAPPPTTAAATTTIATTTTAAPTTTAPSTTLGPVTLPDTGAGSSTGPTAAIGAVALAIGVGLVVVARRRSADV